MSGLYPRLVLPLYLIIFAAAARPALAQEVSPETHAYDWVIKHAQWSPVHETQYEDLIRKIGETVEGRYFHEIDPTNAAYLPFAGKCRTLASCVQDKSVNASTFLPTARLISTRIVPSCPI